MTLPASDAFGGSDGQALTAYSSNWTNNVGAFKIQSGGLYTDYSTGDAAAHWNADTFGNDQYAQATVIAITNTAYIGVAVRCHASAATFYSFTANNDAWYLSKYVSGAYTDLGSGGWGVGFAVNDVVRLEAEGTTIRAKINGTTVVSVTDSGIASGYAGVGGSGNVTGSRIDSWSADNIGSAAQTVNANAISSGATVYQPAITVGAVTVSPNAISSGVTVYQPAVSTGGSPQTINANAISSGATVYQPAVSTGGSPQTVSPNAISSVATVYQPTVTPGAVTVSPNAISSAATVRSPYVLYNLCVAGVLTASSNARYFQNDNGIVVLSGCHTWYTMVDGGVSDPPPTFDYSAWLSFVATRGGNTFKLWAHETPKDWPDEANCRFVPLPFARTGPGNAADGKLKFDLTTFDSDYFDRMRARAAEAGNRGFFVIIQLFQGWQADQKGLGVGDPAQYHPFAAANNINSIDGNPDDDTDILETRDTANTAVYNLQKAYIDKVIATVAGLDNVLLEVSNEETATATVTAWQHAIIDYVHTNDADGHPIGMTWQYPNGSNSTDLYTSNADWISYGANNSTPLSNPVAWPDTGASAFVSLWDPDHMGGLEGINFPEYPWKAFTRGHNVLLMDSYDGTFGDDWTANSTAEEIRYNLGYIQDYAARLDLANTTPQGSLSSTGYAIANTTQVLAYQPGSGNFTVDLSSYSGTYAVEYLRPSNGATSTGTTVSGGAVRTMTAPWAGEDFVVFLDKQGDEIYPNAISSGAQVHQPAVTPGAVTVSANAISSTASVYQPAVTPGAVTVAPNAISSGATVYQPVVTGTGLQQPNPTLGSNIITNGTFDADASWTKGTNWSIGSGVASNSGGANFANLTQAITNAASWGLASMEVVTRTAGAVHLRNSNFVGADRSTAGTYYFAARWPANDSTTGVRCSSSGFTGSVDNITLELITLASMFSTATYGTHGTTKAAVTVVSGTQAGVVANLDSASSPANFVIATHDGTTARLTKCVGGTYTDLISTSATYSAGAYVEVRRLAGTDTYQLWYNGSQVGSNQTISDAGIISNTLAGYFNTYSGNTLTSFASIQTIDASLISSGASVYQPAVTSVATISPNAIGSGATVRQPAVTPGAVTVSASAISSTATVYQPAVLIPTERTIYPNFITSTAQVFTVAVTAIAAGRIYQVQAEDRTWAIPAEDRTYSIGD